MKDESKKQQLFVFVGCSGAGKTTLAEKMVKDGYFNKAITMTTRAPRVGEVDGVDYHFVTKKELFDLYKKGELIEPPNEHAGNFYACPISSLFSDKPVVVILDINGAKYVNDLMKERDDFDLIKICLEAPELPVLLKRFQEQGRTDEEIKSRIDVYERESKWSKMMNFDLILRPDKNKSVIDQMNDYKNKVLPFIRPKPPIISDAVFKKPKQ